VDKLLLEVDFLPFLKKFILKNHKNFVFSAQEEFFAGSGRKILVRVCNTGIQASLVQGELCVKTPQLMLGLKGWEASCTDPEGFFHTGDLGFYDRDGIIHFMEQVNHLLR
jgi:acyl-CoA synthetase (AMP-forming)/AMP-acid ligase II